MRSPMTQLWCAAGLIALGLTGCAPGLVPLIESFLQVAAASDQAGQTARGVPGVSCWDLNGDGVGQLEEDTNGDGAFNALDCQGAGGAKGLSCWDLNGDGVGQPAEDRDGDGNFTAADCAGSSGHDGAAGAPGAAGPQGPQGIPGDTGAQGPAGPQGPSGPGGLGCWDLDGDGLGQIATEDTNGDGNIDVLDCRGADGLAGATGAQGPAGLACWDLNGDGHGQLGSEDINGDGFLDALDCRGPQGEQGPQGAPGETGPPGPQGEQGPPGQATFPDGFMMVSTSPVPPAGFQFTGLSAGFGDRWGYRTYVEDELRGHMVASDGEFIYVLGGRDSWNWYSSNRNLAYSVAGGWEERASLPVPREYGAAVELGGKIYLIGGYSDTPNGWGAVLQVDVYDPAQDSWSSAAPLTSERGGFAAGVIDGKIYIAGGYSSAGSNTGAVYDPATDTWAPIANMPTYRESGGGVAVGGKLYYFGGWQWNSASGTPATTMAIYDAQSNSWSEGPPLGVWRGDFAVAVVNGRIYVIGGENADFADGGGGGYYISATSTVEEFDPVTGYWWARAPLPRPREEAGAAVLDGKIFVIGGGYYYNYNDGGWSYDYDVYAMTPPTVLYIHVMETE